MKQARLQLDLIFKKTPKQIFLEQLEQVVPWAERVELLSQYFPEGKMGRLPFSHQTMLRVHLMQQWLTLSDPGMEDAYFDSPLNREFAQLEKIGTLAGERTILRFRHRLEKHKLAEEVLGIVNVIRTERELILKAVAVVDVTLITAPPSTENRDNKRDPEMHSSKKIEQMHFDMKAHIGADNQSILAHTVSGISGHVNDVGKGNSLLHGEEPVAFDDAGYQSIGKRPDSKANVALPIAMRPCKSRVMDKAIAADDAAMDQAEKRRADMPAKMAHPFRVIKRRFGYVKVRYRGLKKNAAQLNMQFALSNLWTVRSKLMGFGV